MKKLFAILLVFFMVPANVFADDDASKVGLYIGFGGSSDAIGVAYDLGTGMQLGLGLGFDSWLPDEGKSTNRLIFRPMMIYSLGKGLLGYGVGLRASIVYFSGTEDTNVSVTPNFYVSAPLVPNVAISVNAGLQVGMPEGGVTLGTAMSALLIFYFL